MPKLRYWVMGVVRATGEILLWYYQR